MITRQVRVQTELSMIQPDPGATVKIETWTFDWVPSLGIETTESSTGKCDRNFSEIGSWSLEVLEPDSILAAQATHRSDPVIGPLHISRAATRQSGGVLALQATDPDLAQNFDLRHDVGALFEGLQARGDSRCRGAR